ncbi:hypothetical protein [Halomonas sp. C05BenzN]|uniref:hypothetical protein n=1 Tax=Halomonas sp. C05BenzN TaxID=3411041 RepID=UPI003B929192
MTEEEHRRVIDALQDVIVETQETIERLEAAGMQEALAEDYHQLFEVLDRANRQQRQHTLEMLDLGVVRPGPASPGRLATSGSAR